MKIATCVPIKVASERLPDKNTKAFTNGDPLCRYLLETLLQVDGLDGVYVYCSDQAIRAFLPPGVIWLPRSRELDRPETLGMDIVTAFIRQVEADAYLLAHVTSPFLRAASIRAGLRAVTDEGHDSALSVTPLREFAWMDGKPLNYDLSAVPRTQNLPVIFVETSGFFVFRKEIAVEHGRRIGFNPKFVEVSKIEAIDIDYPEDFAIADALFNFGLTR